MASKEETLAKIAAGKDAEYAVRDAAPVVRADKEVLLVAVAKDFLALRHAAAELKADKDVVLAAVAQNGWALEHAAAELKADKEVVLAGGGRALRYAAAELKADKDVVLAAVAQDWRALEHASLELKADKDVVLAAVAQNCWALEHAAAELKADKDVVLAVVGQDGGALRYAAAELQADKEVVLAALAQNGWALEHASLELQHDRELVLAAAEQLQKDEQAVRAAVQRAPAQREFVLLVVKGTLFDENQKVNVQAASLAELYLTIQRQLELHCSIEIAIDGAVLADLASLPARAKVIAQRTPEKRALARRILEVELHLVARQPVVQQLVLEVADLAALTGQLVAAASKHFTDRGEHDLVALVAAAATDEGALAAWDSDFEEWFMPTELSDLTSPCRLRLHLSGAEPAMQEPRPENAADVAVRAAVAAVPRPPVPAPAAPAAQAPPPSPPSTALALYDPAEFKPAVDFPVGIFSYASASDGGKGIDHMWAIGNALRLHGISTYCGLMVRTKNWQQKWFGKLNKAKFAIVMLSDAYWKSGPCIEEVTKILEKGIQVFIVRVDRTCHSCTRGNFLGESVDQIDQAGFIKLKLNMNCLPPPHEPLFQEPANFGANAAELAEQIMASVPDAVDTVPVPAAAATAALPVAEAAATAKSAAVDHDHQEEAEPEPEAASTTAAAAQPPAAAAAEQTVAAWLQETKLGMCEGALAEAGYDAELEMVVDGDDEEVADIIAAVEAIAGVKKPTVKKFKRELAKLRGKGESFD
jgi:hypothetical protein